MKTAKQNKDSARLPRYAAIDLGSNNCRLLIATPPNQEGISDSKKDNQANHFQELPILDAFSCSVRLGEGLRSTGRLSPAAMGRAREALQICQRKMLHAGTTRFRGIATEACRKAANAQDFLSLIQSQFNLEFDIISPEEEAQLAWQGCLPLAVEEATDLLVFDIGGASTQLIYAKKIQNEWVWQDWLSLEEGVVSLFDRIGAGPFTKAEYQAHISELQKNISVFEQKNKFSTFIHQEGNEGLNPNVLQLIGTSGTVTTLCGALKGLKTYARDNIDGEWLNRIEALGLMESLAQKTPIERQAHDCIGKDRADLVVSGCILLEAIWQTWPVSNIRVADRGLREGILAGMMKEDGYNV